MDPYYERNLREIMKNPIVLPYEVLIERVQALEEDEGAKQLCAVVYEYSAAGRPGTLIYSPLRLNINAQRVYAVCTPDVGAEKMKTQADVDLVTLRFFQNNKGTWVVDRSNCCVFIYDAGMLRLAVFNTEELNIRQIDSYKEFLTLLTAVFELKHPEELV